MRLIAASRCRSLPGREDLSFARVKCPGLVSVGKTVDVDSMQNTKNVQVSAVLKVGRLSKMQVPCLEVRTPFILLVGAGRFERPTPCAQGRCATRLRYAPTFAASLILNYFFRRHRSGDASGCFHSVT
jgi:hypothetical protein